MSDRADDAVVAYSLNYIDSWFKRFDVWLSRTASSSINIGSVRPPDQLSPEQTASQYSGDSSARSQRFSGG